MSPVRRLPRGAGGLISLAIDGVDPLAAILAAAGPRANLTLARALLEEANAIVGDAVALVPVRRGILRASADVSLPRITRTSVTLELGFGGAASDYAVAQHENLTYRHARGRTAKFLETPALARAEGMDRRLARRLRSILRSGAGG